MIDILKPKNIKTTIRELNRARLAKRHAKKMGAIPEPEARDRKRRVPYTLNAPANAHHATPLVSIIIVGFNGERHLHALTESLKRQTYRHFEVIYVDNASRDQSVNVMRQCYPDARIIEHPTNAGFAEGNNIGADHANGDLLLLLNNDAKLSETALQHMVATLCADPDIGVVAPKIRFWEEFHELKIDADPTKSDLRVNVTESRTGYRKAIKIPSASSRAHHFLIPISAQKIEVLTPTEPLATWQGTLNGIPVDQARPLPTGGTSTWIINNAGSWVNGIGEAGDWGFGEPDQGQYDTPCLVDAFCGCCALIRTSALGLKPLFPADFFAYFEDTDTSERIRRAGFQIVYQPAALVYHQHASTSVEGSALYQYFTKRNGLVFQARYFPHRFHLQAESYFERWHHEGISSYTTQQIIKDSPCASDRSLIEDTLALATQARNGALYQRQFQRKRIGIFNEYWKSMGGGELRALHIALAMRAHGDVYLISRTPVDIIEICKYFNLPHAGLKLSVVPDFSDQDTSDIDIFINTAFSSTIHSRAQKSIFIVSFPHTHGHISEMLSYDILLANSIFTRNWCNNYWPKANTKLLYPAVNVAPTPPDLGKKERIILSIGRFFPSGHSKRQVEMVEAFRKLVQMGHTNWRLVLIGGCNHAKSQDQEYFNQVKQAAAGLPIDIIVDAPSDVVQSHLQMASIYWHATGVGLKDYTPINFEHFGMAIVEAMSHGAVPIIHNRGGAPEIVVDGQSGYHFDTLSSLTTRTDQLISLQQSNLSAFHQLSNSAHQRSLAFSLGAHDRTLHQLLLEHVL